MSRRKFEAERASADDFAITNPLDFNLDDYGGLGYTYRGKPIADLEQVVEQIDSGAAMKVTANNTITYTFLKEGQGLTGLYNNKNYGFTAGDGLAAFTDAQRAEARDSIALWDDLVAPKFKESNGRGADIQFANSTDPAQAYAYYPNEKYGYKYLGDVFIADPEVNWTNGWLGFNGYGATTLVHELGHSLGLSHPGNYNYDPELELNYDNYAEYAQDSEQYTLMSYWGPGETGATIVNWNLLLYGNAQTPMLHDIYVIQEKYGADMTTRTGDTVYGFNSTADRDVFDFTANEFPNVAIWDAGGEDTLDFSGFFGGSVLNLNAGQFSSGGSPIPTATEINANVDALEDETGYPLGYVDQATVDGAAGSFLLGNAAKVADDWGYDGVYAVNFDNIAIAYGAEIENAVGSEYRDIIVANELDNELTGNGGSDVFVFLHGGEDTIIDFESGSDVIDFSHMGLSADEATIAISDGMLEVDFDSDSNVDLTLNFANGAAIQTSDIVFA